MNIAFQLALHDYSASIDVGFNAPVRSDGQTVSFRVDGAFYLAIYINVFAAREFPFNHNRLANAGYFPAESIRRFERFHECSPLGDCSGEFDSTPMRTTPRRQRQGSGKGSLEAIPRADGIGPCSGSPQRVPLLTVHVGWLGPRKARRERP